MSAADPRSIFCNEGAKAGDRVVGLHPKNRGLILKLRQDQLRGESGSVKGRFDVIEAGDGDYADYIAGFIGQTLNASEMTEMLLSAINSSRTKSLSKLTIFDRNSLGVAPPAE
jgi:hypothetical protein